jgi:hypothetical protein
MGVKRVSKRKLQKGEKQLLTLQTPPRISGLQVSSMSAVGRILTKSSFAIQNVGSLPPLVDPGANLQVPLLFSRRRAAGVSIQAGSGDIPRGLGNAGIYGPA